MPASAYAVAYEIRLQLPTVAVKKLHKLLYFGQGMHLAWFGTPLFRETISAWDMGPVVGTFWKAEKDGQLPVVSDELDESQRNTISYVVSRYGGLTGRDLEVLTHSQAPWRRANEERHPGGSNRLENSWLRDWFHAELERDDDVPALDVPTLEVRRQILAGAVVRRTTPAASDDLDVLRARLNS